MSLNRIVELVISQENQEPLFEIIFSDDHQIDRQKMLNFLSRLVKKADSSEANFHEIEEALRSIQNNGYCYQKFLECLKLALVSPDDPNYSTISLEHIDVLDIDVFWSMVPIAMKKCLGSNFAKATINNNQNYFSAMPADLNSKQIDCHQRCINSFNLDANTFSRKEYKELGVFLHSFHSKNRRPLTRKKNLKRVERRTKKIMQAYKLAHNGMKSNIFSDGRYKVPSQFSDYISKEFLAK